MSLLRMLQNSETTLSTHPLGVLMERHRMLSQKKPSQAGGSSFKMRMKRLQSTNIKDSKELSEQQAKFLDMQKTSPI